jgi:hypothetical protein
MENDSLQLEHFNTIKTSKVDWLWYPYIPCGKITVLQGDPGAGKSMFMIETISRLTKGEKLPDGMTRQPVEVIYQCSEDGLADTIKPRLDKAGADCERVAFIREDINSFTLNDDILHQAMIRSDARLLVIDPFQAYIGDSDLSNVSSMRRIMSKLSMWASASNCAVILIGHMTKKSHAKELYRGLGSVDIVALARSVIQIECSEENPQIRYIRHIKSSLSGLGPELMFTIDRDGRFKWINEQSTVPYIAVSSTDMENVSGGKIETAANLIIQLLSQGPQKATQVTELITNTGISGRTVNQAKRQIGIVSSRKNGQWYWSLPTQDQTIHGIIKKE